MHVLFREKHGLEETDIPVDLKQNPADLVFLSYSDSDLNAFAEGWRRGYKSSPENFITLRLANITYLRHPLSVDTYIENTLSKTKGILIRLIGGVPYWEYGLNQIYNLALKKNIPLAVLPADGRQDERLDKMSNLPISTLRQLSKLCDQGGPIASQAALAQMALATGLKASPVIGKKTIPSFGFWKPSKVLNSNEEKRQYTKKNASVIIVFYRSFITANDLNPIKELYYSLKKSGIIPLCIFVPSLKEPDSAKWIEDQITLLQPSCIINVTSFSSKNKSGSSPLDIGNVPVFQIALSTNKKSEWKNEERGLSPTDMAMHVALPEIDGRIFLGVASFKEKMSKDVRLEFNEIKHQSYKNGIKSITKKIKAWINLQKYPLKNKKLAFVLSSYPGKNWQIAHAVGLDTISSVEAMFKDLNYMEKNKKLNIITNLNNKTVKWSVSNYKKALENIPKKLKNDLLKKWGQPEKDKNCINSFFVFKGFFIKNIFLGIQPERSNIVSKKNDYHDLDLIPSHNYVAFYLWLQSKMLCEGLIHVGAHGTLEWLPGKSVALSENCWPEILIGSMPIIYPFIMNDPGEAIQAKRRINAVTISHIPPTLVKAENTKKFELLETLLDEFSNADGLDPKRRDRLKLDIRNEAKSLGIEEDLGFKKDLCQNAALTKIDRFVCDIKETQFGYGLHIFGRKQTQNTKFNTNISADCEKQNLINCISGKRIEPGPAGSPYRGRLDVLPSGRNIYASDALSLPSRSSYLQGDKIADEFIKNYLQQHGEWPKSVIIDLWGSATMRTNGEEFSMALSLLGAKPTWSDGTERVSGIEILPTALMDRPRIDVTLRVSGLFRDIFPTLSILYNQVIEALSDRDENPDWNPFIKEKKTPRVFGPKPGTYGVKGNFDISENFLIDQKKIGESWLESSSWSINGNKFKQELDEIKKRVIKSDSFIHLQDLKETDILLNADYAKHQGGFAAAKKIMGGHSDLFHIDISDEKKIKVKNLKEEISKIVIARASNPKWIKGMQNHGYRGAAEISETLDNLVLYSQLTNSVSNHLFDMYYEATIGNSDVFNFMKDVNIEALNSMRFKFKELYNSEFWKTQSNSIAVSIEGI
jgi:cobaltochelatase CobN